MTADSGQSLHRDSRCSWVMVAGDFTRAGGMDRANAELAAYLAASGATVHLVAFRVEAELAANENIRVHLAARIAGAHSLSRHRLDRLGRTVAAAVLAAEPQARVLVNGVNCAWPDINWVHFVHHKWLATQPDAPLWFRLKDGLASRANLSREARLLERARLLIANSERTRADLIHEVGVGPERVRTVYLGCGAEWQPVTPEQRNAARSRFALPPQRPLVAFAGALGHDSRKGFDTLWSAWRSLCASPDWDADLIVAGGGRALPRWRREVVAAGLESRVRLLGFTDRVVEVLAAADLLVSPARYEAYGLNVQEALCCGVPAIVSGTAGVAERYPAELGELLLPDPGDVGDLVARLRRWRADIAGWKRRVAPLGAALRAWSWRDMAAQIVAAAATAPQSAAPLAAMEPLLERTGGSR